VKADLKKPSAATPVEEVKAGRAFYQEVLPGCDTTHFESMWHIFSVGHLVAVDLDRIARQFDLSIADLHFLGTLRIERARPLRATDLTRTLHVSNAVLTLRVDRLVQMGFVVRNKSGKDRRAFDLWMTELGAQVADSAIRAIAAKSSIARLLREMAPEDRCAVERILGHLHNELDRLA